SCCKRKDRSERTLLASGSWKRRQQVRELQLQPSEDLSVREAVGIERRAVQNFSGGPVKTCLASAVEIDRQVRAADDQHVIERYRERYFVVMTVFGRERRVEYYCVVVPAGPRVVGECRAGFRDIEAKIARQLSKILAKRCAVGIARWKQG